MAKTNPYIKNRKICTFDQFIKKGEKSQKTSGTNEKGEADLTKKAQSLRETLKLDALLLTRSEEGMSLFTANGVEHVKAQAREVFDVSGAGDTVIATMAVALAAGWAPGKAMALANKAGGIVVGKLGTATVSLEELQ